MNLAEIDTLSKSFSVGGVGQTDVGGYFRSQPIRATKLSRSVYGAITNVRFISRQVGGASTQKTAVLDQGYFSLDLPFIFFFSFLFGKEHIMRDFSIKSI